MLLAARSGGQPVVNQAVQATEPAARVGPAAANRLKDRAISVESASTSLLAPAAARAVPVNAVDRKTRP